MGFHPSSSPANSCSAFLTQPDFVFTSSKTVPLSYLPPVAVVPYSLPSTIITLTGEYPSVRSLKSYITVSVAAHPQTAPAEISSNIAARALKNEKLAERDLH